ncbi:MAG: ABC transporter ATP-binding protein [Rikenellaceae bacterium]
MESTLSASGLEIGYREGRRHRDVVHSDINFALRAGELTTLMGVNGAGKSTLIKTLCGFLPPLAGEVSLLGRPLKSYSEAQRAKILGVVLTEKGAGGGLTSYELVSLGRHPHTGFFGELREADHEIISGSLRAVGIEHKAKSYISQLSDGERQKVMIAKALAQQCPIIILDEPTAFLDVASRIDTMVLLRRLAADMGKTILLSSHDLDMSIQFSDNIMLQKRGEPLLIGSPEELILDGRMSRFLSRDGVLFDEKQGRLTTPLTERYIRVEAEPRLAFWLSNALIRWGFNPNGESSAILVKALSITSFEVDGHRCSSLAELRERLYSAIGSK